MKCFLALLSVYGAWAFGPASKTKTIYIVRHGEKIDGNKDAATPELAHEAQCLSEKGWARSYNLKSVFGRGSAEYHGFKTPDAIFSCNYGEPLDCRDRHGWFRTQQLVAALAESLDIKVNNKTGFQPDLCGMVWNEESKAGYIDHKASKQAPPYDSLIRKWTEEQPSCTGEKCTLNGKKSCHVRGFGPQKCDKNGKNCDLETRDDDGTCCNADAAHKMLKKLKQQDVNTILVGWEHGNINWLAAALSYQDYTTFMKTAAVWPDEDYDRVYALHYDAQSLEFKGIETQLQQGFDYPSTVTFGTQPAKAKVFLGPQSYCGAVAESSMDGTPDDGYPDGTPYTAGGGVAFPGPPLDRFQPVPGTKGFTNWYGPQW
eukprot:CAMPEP_0119310160 /NCGR_PEP_ID=MMETSP1333-20130426/17850_1 /TAXON_ID=418940 /ORGANISM="Scyphosphaera apsteinii, Strain RCC1455" /LENGTH=371 /DNA_ID=CAMNT_0007314289 /DNA_START=81 /DNA_END=1193 /DNA_ORIENTATION=-